MTYYESAKGEIINRERVINEFKRHGVPEYEYNDFFKDYKDEADAFDAQLVLIWLGY